jgi:hypothetical protein
MYPKIIPFIKNEVKIYEPGMEISNTKLIVNTNLKICLTVNVYAIQYL